MLFTYRHSLMKTHAELAPTVVTETIFTSTIINETSSPLIRSVLTLTSVENFAEIFLNKHLDNHKPLKNNSEH